jgi:uncharacterized membrane protein
MSDLVVIAFPTEANAEEVRQKLLAMQKEYLPQIRCLRALTARGQSDENLARPHQGGGAAGGSGRRPGGGADLSLLRRRANAVPTDPRP